MHLTGLGLVPTTMNLVQAYLKATQKNSAFIAKTAPVLEPIVSLSIDWCNAQRYTGEGFGHWVSENYLAFARLMPWYYQGIDAIVAPVVELPPESRIKSWRKDHCEQWLRSRGQDTSGLLPDLRDRVANLLQQDEPPPVIPQPERPVEFVEQLLVAMYNLLECIMITVVTPEVRKKTGYCVRVYLSAYLALRAVVRNKDQDSSYFFSTYNLACLMNLEKRMGTFGPLRDIWEGGTRGEGFF